MFESISLVEPDSQTRPYDEGDYIGEKQGEVSLVLPGVLSCWTVLTLLPALTETAGGAISLLQPPLWRGGHVDPGAPVPEVILQRHFSLAGKVLRVGRQRWGGS